MIDEKKSVMATRTGQQVYEARRAITTRASNNERQTRGIAERSRQAAPKEAKGTASDEGTATHMMNATFIEQKEERTERMLTQALKAILWLKEASKRHMSEEVGGGAINSLGCVELLIQETRQQLTDAYRVIKTQSEALSTSQPSHRSWAQTASWSNTSSGDASPRTQSTEAILRTEPTRATDTRKAKGITVRIDDKKEREDIGKLRDEKNTYTQQILAARRLNGGDLLLQTVSVKGREELEKKDEWTRKTFTSARVLKQTFPILIHGVHKKAIDVSDQEESKGKRRRLKASPVGSARPLHQKRCRSPKNGRANWKWRKIAVLEFGDCCSVLQFLYGLSLQYPA